MATKKTASRATKPVFVVEVTCPTKNEALRIGEAAVKGKLAACSNVSGPVNSTYTWSGSLQTHEEYILSLKTTSRACLRLQRKITQLHSDKVPSVLVFKNVGASKDYSLWVRKNCR